MVRPFEAAAGSLLEEAAAAAAAAAPAALGTPVHRWRASPTEWRSSESEAPSAW